MRIVMLAIHPDGQKVGGSQQVLDIPSTDGKGRTVTANDVLDLPRGGGSVRVSVVSERTGRAGVVHIPVSVPDMRADAQLLPLVLGLATSSQAGSKIDLLSSVVPFQPTTKRVFGSGDTLLLLARTVNSPDGQVTWAIRSNGQVVKAFDGERVSPSDYVLRLPLGGLSPGAYSVEAVLRDGRKTIVSAVPFTIR
jgi:hypothetical protein